MKQAEPAFTIGEVTDFFKQQGINVTEEIIQGMIDESGMKGDPTKCRLMRIFDCPECGKRVEVSVDPLIQQKIWESEKWRASQETISLSELLPAEPIPPPNMMDIKNSILYGDKVGEVLQDYEGLTEDLRAMGYDVTPEQAKKKVGVILLNPDFCSLVEQVDCPHCHAEIHLPMDRETQRKLYEYEMMKAEQSAGSAVISLEDFRKKLR